MPIIQTSNGFIYKKNKKNTKKINSRSNFLFIFFSIICTALIIYLNFSYDFINLLNLNKYQMFNEKKYYGVAIKKTNTFDDLNDDSISIKTSDGAGYIYENGSIYYLLLSCYANKEDAEKVLAKNKEKNLFIVDILLPSITYHINYSSESIKCLRNALSLVNRCFDELYSISISYDRGEILDAEAKQKISNLREKCQLEKEGLANCFKTDCDNVITHVKIFQSEIISSLSTLTFSRNLSSDIKYVYINILDNFSKMENQIKK